MNHTVHPHPTSEPVSAGPGRFVTFRVLQLDAALKRVATSRRHRKGLPPHEVTTSTRATRAPVTQPGAFRHLWAPERLGWWIALLFAIGSFQFLLAALAATWPTAAPVALRDATTVGWVFFSGSVFFTAAAWLQWLEALNGDIETALDGTPQRWLWFGVRPRNLGYLACSVQLLGTLLFNANTADALIPMLGWQEQDLLIWTPNMIGSICFLVASGLAYAEVSHCQAAFEPQSVSWWIAIINLAGSLAFQVSAIAGFVSPSSESPAIAFLSTLLTAIGALCFLVGAYLLVPELFDYDSESASFSDRG